MDSMFHTTYNEKTKTWHGLPRVPTYNPNVSVGQILLESLGKYPKRIGQINADNGVKMTNNEIRIKTIRAAIQLTKLGYKVGDVFGFYARNTEYLTPIVFASLTIGVACNAIDVSFKKDEVSHMFSITKPVVIFCDFDCVDDLKEAMPSLDIPIFTFRGSGTDTRAVEELFLEDENENWFSPPEIGDGTKSVALIICSSGTTGLPKGLALSHASVLHHLLSSSFYFRDEIIISFSSIFWASGYYSLFLGTLLDCQRIITTEKYSPDLLFDLIEKYKISFLLSTPTMLASMLQHPNIAKRDLSSLKMQICGGSAVHPELITKMNNYIPDLKIYAAYGTTEHTGGLTINYPNSVLGSVGQLTMSMQVRIIDEDGERCGINEDGEIFAKPIFPFLGYYGRPNETEEIFGEDGYIGSGDIGHFDENGNLFIVDRKKDVFKCRNVPVSPSEIENVILMLRGVENVCVVGIPDFESTDLPAALVVRTKNMEEHVVNEENIHNIIKDNLTDAKMLRGGIYFTDILPMTISGKILRREVKRIVMELHANKK